MKRSVTLDDTFECNVNIASVIKMSGDTVELYTCNEFNKGLEKQITCDEVSEDILVLQMATGYPLLLLGWLKKAKQMKRGQCSGDRINCVAAHSIRSENDTCLSETRLS
jgi:hypothetical protein